MTEIDRDRWKLPEIELEFDRDIVYRVHVRSYKVYVRPHNESRAIETDR